MKICKIDKGKVTTFEDFKNLVWTEATPKEEKLVLETLAKIKRKYEK